MSGASSLYGSATEEQRQLNEVRRLKNELSAARDQIMSLSSQLSTNVSRNVLIFNSINKSLFELSFFAYDNNSLKLP